jgi:amidohydrolase
MRDFHNITLAQREGIIAVRRELHRFPEVAFEEVYTSQVITERLAKLGLEVQTGIGKTGVIGILEGRSDGPTVLVRADMDALPILEETGLPFASQNTGKMHACGHDGHMAIVLAVAGLLHAERQHLRGRVMFVFQPAEEIGAGARAMLESPLVPQPDYAFGLHLWADLPTGEVAVVPGELMAGAGVFTLDILGRGGHAARPNQAADPIIAAAHIISALQTLVSRNVPPTETAVLSVTQVYSGEAFNIIPNKVTLRGTYRTFTRPVRDLLVTRFHEVVTGLAQALGCQVQLYMDDRVPPLVNDPQVTSQLLADYQCIAPQWRYHSQYRAMESEDMSLFLQKTPGTYLLVGCGGASPSPYPLHHPQYTIDEEALIVGASLLASTVSRYVFSD